MNVCIIFYNLGAYHLSRLSAARIALEKHGHQLACIEVTRGTSEHPWGDFQIPNYVTTLEQFQKGDRPAVSSPKKIHDALSRLNPDVVVIPGWGHNFARAALKWCLTYKKPRILMSESKRDDAKRHPVKEFWKKHRYVSRFSAALVGGRKHSDYLCELGMERSQIFFGYDVVDSSYLASEVDGIRKSCQRAIDIPGRNYVLSVNRFIKRKNLTTLIKAFAASIASSHHDWDLVLLGGGAEEQNLRKTARDTGYSSRIHFPGFKSYSEIPNWYAHAGIFVHPAQSEQWGLVVNEAMAAELPIVLSQACGCHPDLLEEGKNGLSFQPLDTATLSNHLTNLISTEASRLAMGKRSREIIEESFSPHRFGDGLASALKLVTKT